MDNNPLRSVAGHPPTPKIAMVMYGEFSSTGFNLIDLTIDQVKLIHRALYAYMIHEQLSEKEELFVKQIVCQLHCVTANDSVKRMTEAIKKNNDSFSILKGALESNDIKLR